MRFTKVFPAKFLKLLIRQSFSCHRFVLYGILPMIYFASILYINTSHTGEWQVGGNGNFIILITLNREWDKYSLQDGSCTNRLTCGFGLVFTKMLLLSVPMTVSAPSRGTNVDNP